MPTPRTRWFLLVAAAVPLALASGCPQLASDDFTKSDEPFDAEGNGSGGSDDGGANDTSPSIDLTNSTQTSSNGNENTTSTSQGGTDAGSNTSEGDEVTSSADTSGGAGGTSGTGGTGGDTASSGGSTSTDTSASSGGSTSDTSGTGGSSTDGVATSSGCVVADEICDGLDNDCDDEIDEDVCDGSYGCQGFAYLERGYMYCPRPASQEEAAAQCDGQGMNLVQIDSESENDAMVTQASTGWSGNDGSGGGGSTTTWGSGTRNTGGEEQQEGFWTGGSDELVEGEWIWSASETPFWEGDAEGNAVDGAYTNWGEARPNGANDEGENCMAVYVADGSDGDMGTWNDLPCGDSYPFICESPASD